MNAIVKFDAVTELAGAYGLESEAFVHTMKSIAMPKAHTDEELVSCLLVAREHGLNPLTKEIYFMRTQGGSVQAIVGVDGWIRKINEHPQYDGMTWDAPEMDDKGVAVSMTCHIHRKDRKHPITVTEYMAECRQDKSGPWKTHPNRMLRNRTICQTARIAFGFAGIMEPDEFSQWQANEVAGGKLTPVGDFELDTKAGASPKHGGDWEAGRKGRITSSAAKDTGLDTTFEALVAEIRKQTTKADLLDLYDQNERNGEPWANYPQGWANALHTEHQHRLAELDEAPAEDEELADQEGLIAALDESITAAKEMARDKPELMDMVREIQLANDDLVARCSADNQSTIETMYAEALS